MLEAVNINYRDTLRKDGRVVAYGGTIYILMDYNDPRFKNLTALDIDGDDDFRRQCCVYYTYEIEEPYNNRLGKEIVYSALDGEDIVIGELTEDERNSLINWYLLYGLEEIEKAPLYDNMNAEDFYNVYSPLTHHIHEVEVGGDDELYDEDEDFEAELWDGFFKDSLNIDSSPHRRVAKFEKVSECQFIKDMIDHDLITIDNTDVTKWYADIVLPKRGTRGSAGYDFVAPYDIVVKPGESLVVCSGVRCNMQENWVLKAYPRSSSGTRYRLQFNNTIPVIDSDYYYTDNEGHIMFKIFNDSREGKVFKLNKGEKLCQGVFVEYGITYDDCVTTSRTGGFGSTGK